jgi:hypothetical protein
VSRCAHACQPPPGRLPSGAATPVPGSSPHARARL